MRIVWLYSGVELPGWCWCSHDFPNAVGFERANAEQLGWFPSSEHSFLRSVTCPSDHRAYLEHVHSCKFTASV